MPANLTSGDSIRGGTGFDNVQFLTGGVVAVNAFADVQGIDAITLNSAGNTVTITNAVVATADAGALAVIGGAGNDTVNASAATAMVNFRSNGGNDSFTGGSSNDTAFFGASDLTSGDTIVGGAAYDAIQFTSAGMVAATAFDNVSGVDALVLVNGGNTVTLNNHLTGGSEQGASRPGPATTRDKRQRS